MVNFGPLATKIVSLVWGTPSNFNRFRVLAALLHGTLVVGVSQTAALNRGRHLYSAGRPSRWALAHILVSTFFAAVSENLFFDCESTKMRRLQRLPCCTTTTTVLRPFFRDHPGESVPEENFWTLWCKGRLTEADTPTIWLGATPAGLTSAHLHHPPYFLTGRMPFLPSNQQRQSTEGN